MRFATRVARGLLLPVINFYIDVIGCAYRWWWFRQPWTLSADGHHPLAHLGKLQEGTPYGADAAETADVVEPMLAPAEPTHAVVYLHGGGFVSCCSYVLLQSIPVTMARQGLRTFSLDYPLAPEAPFPRAVVSVLRALAWMRRERGIEAVTLMGDSVRRRRRGCARRGPPPFAGGGGHRGGGGAAGGERGAAC